MRLSIQAYASGGAVNLVVLTCWAQNESTLLRLPLQDILHSLAAATALMVNERKHDEPHHMDVYATRCRAPIRTSRLRGVNGHRASAARLGRRRGLPPLG